ncbi:MULTISPECIES: hypothetical protein [Lonepinella]
MFKQSRGSIGKRSIRSKLSEEDIHVGLLIRNRMNKLGLFSKQPPK